MKQFLKYVLASIIGVSIVLFLSTFVFIATVGAIASAGDAEKKPSANSVFQLELSGELKERLEESPFAELLAKESGKKAPLGLDDVLENIKKAKENPNIVGIQLNCGALVAGYASLKEIRDALIDFKSSGKFIVSYADFYSQKAYYLASVSDKILLNPIGVLGLTGLSSTTTFFKNLLENIGVEMQIVRVGQFKSAVEPMVETKMSDANRKQTEVFLFSIWNNILRDIESSRKITIAQLNKYCDENLQTFTQSPNILSLGLVDSLVYQSEVKEIVKSFMKKEVEPKYISHATMKKVTGTKKYEKNKVAVIYAVGGIDVSIDGIQSEKLVKTIQKASKENSVKAVVLRINSPGGSAYGSEQIWKALTDLKKEKPLIVSMGDYAASGGYYIACMGDKILAQPGTLTGSIGVFGQIPNAQKLADKVGLNFDVVKTNKFSEGISAYRPFTAEERSFMQGSVNEVYELFVKRCAEGRGKTTDEIKKIAEGRVWSGENALEIGLIDTLGGLNDAILLAAEAAEIEKYKVVHYPEKEDFFSRLIKEMSNEAESYVLKSYLGEHYASLLEKANMFNQLDGVYTMMPYDIEIK